MNAIKQRIEAIIQSKTDKQVSNVIEHNQAQINRFLLTKFVLSLWQEEQTKNHSHTTNATTFTNNLFAVPPKIQVNFQHNACYKSTIPNCEMWWLTIRKHSKKSRCL